MNPSSRRSVLRTAGGALTGLVAGCLGNNDTAADVSYSPTTRSTDVQQDPATPAVTEKLSVDGAWPTFQYDNANTGHNPTGAALTDGSLAWQVSTGGPGRFIGPTVADGRVYLQERWNGETWATARRATDGELLWAHEHPDGGVGMAAAVAGNNIIFTATRGIYALDSETGEQRWITNPDGYPTTAPTVSGDVVLITTKVGHDAGENAGLHALDTATGDHRWSYPLDAGLDAAATIADGTAIIADAAGTIHAVATSDGTRRWTSTVDAAVKTTAATSAETACLTDVDGVVHAVSVVDGSEKWHSSATSPVPATGLAVADGTVYAGGHDSLHAFDAASGATVWTHETDGLTSTPAVGAGVVYVGDENRVVSIDAATGELLWSHRFPQVSDSDVLTGGLSTPPAPVEGGLFIHAADGVYAFGQ